MPLFHLWNVKKSYGPRANQRAVLQIDELSIQQGEILAIVGPSGAGKSTLLRLLNFLDFPTAGTIEFDGKRYNATEQPGLAARRRITTVFQKPALLTRTVYANVAYGLKLRGASVRRDSESDPVQQALIQVGLEQLANQQARTLSGGEMQRVALARAMVIKPDVLLLDEPTANLDPQNVALIESIVSGLNRERGTTIVLVTHNLFQARRLSQRMAFLLEGQVVEVGPTEALFTQPNDPRTRAFVSGDMIY